MTGSRRDSRIHILIVFRPGHVFCQQAHEPDPAASGIVGLQRHLFGQLHGEVLGQTYLFTAPPYTEGVETLKRGRLLVVRIPQCAFPV